MSRTTVCSGKSGIFSAELKKRKGHKPDTFPCVEVELVETDNERLIELLWELGTIGVHEETGKLQAFFDPEARIEVLRSALEHEVERRLLSVGELQFSNYECDPDAWLAGYKSSFKAFEIDSTFYVYPSWGKPSSSHPVNILIDPGHGFGTGTHESTQLCLRALERQVSQVETLLDFGTGSGILSIAAGKLKPSLRITAFDLDFLAVEAARRNCLRNGQGKVRLFSGTSRAIRMGFQLVVANLTMAIIREAAAELVRLSSKDLVVSGFTVGQKGTVASTLTSQSTFTLFDSWEKAGWVCLHLRKSDETCPS